MSKVSPSNLRGARCAPALLILAVAGVNMALPRPLFAKERPRGGEISTGPCAGVKRAATPSYRSFFGRQRVVSDQSHYWRIELSRWERLGGSGMQFSFRLRNRRTRTTSHLTFTSNGSTPFFADQIDEVDLAGQSRAVLFARTVWGVSTMYVIELPGGGIVDHFLAIDPAISPGHRYLAFVKAFPEHPGPVSVNYEYLVYDLAHGPAYNRPHFKARVVYGAGWPVYPPGATNAPGENIVPGLAAAVHQLSSGRLFWLGPHTLAFTDHYKAEDKLVIVDLEKGVKEPSVRTLTIDPGKVLDLEKCKKAASPSDLSRWSRDWAGLIRVTQISRTPGTARAVCLRFSSQPLPAPSCLRLTDLQVTLP